MFTKLCWALTLVGTLAAGGVLALTILTATGAPQQAAGAAVSVAVAVIPYVFTRAVEGLSRP
jgi:hypothetical protein